MRSTANRLAISPDLAPPMPSLTAKTKSAESRGASPVFPRYRTSWRSMANAKKASSLFARTRPRSVNPDHLRIGGSALTGGGVSEGGTEGGDTKIGLRSLRRQRRRGRDGVALLIQQGGKFEIDQAEPSIGRSIGHIAHEPIFVTDPEGFQFGKKFDHSFGIEVFDNSTAIGRDYFQPIGIRFQQSGYKIALSCLEVIEHPHLV